MASKGLWGDEDEEEEEEEVATFSEAVATEHKEEEDDLFMAEHPYDEDHDDEEQQEDYGGDDDYQAERNVRERTSYGNDEAGPAEGQNPRMFYALRNQNRSEEELFLDHYEKYCYQHVPRIASSRTDHPFVRLLARHPHPKFLNIPLCVATLAFQKPNKTGGVEYVWNPAIYEQFAELYTPHDIYRYIQLFTIYG